MHHDSDRFLKTLMNRLEAGALGDPTLAGKQLPIPKKRP